jgi:hypothetical protein
MPPRCSSSGCAASWKRGLVGREEQSRNLKLFADSMNQTLARLTESNAAHAGSARHAGSQDP